MTEQRTQYHTGNEDAKIKASALADLKLALQQYEEAGGKVKVTKFWNEKRSTVLEIDGVPPDEFRRDNIGGRIYACTGIRKLTYGKVTKHARILGFISGYVGKEGRPLSASKIANGLGYTIRYVYDVLSELESEGFIQRETSKGGRAMFTTIVSQQNCN